jgi:hypothetical protein
MEARVKREEDLHVTSIAGVKEAHKTAVAEMKAEVADLKAEIREEFKKFGKKVDELNWRLSP